MLGDTRARLTIIDVVWITAALFVAGVLIGPIFTALENNAGSLGTGEAYLFQMVPAGIVLTILIVLWQIAVTGGDLR